jgi:hypothetical protein
MQSINLEDGNRLHQQPDREIHLLQNLKSVVQQAKQELNNDVTRLAIKSMPIMLASNKQDQLTVTPTGPQDLEILDLDVQ